MNSSAETVAGTPLEGVGVRPTAFDRFPHFARRLSESMIYEYGGTACLECSGGRNADGYVQVQADGRKFYAHRLAYELAFGAIPHGVVVRHRCRNRICCNPRHLMVGSVLENVRDQIQDGTFRREGSKRRLSLERAAWVKFLLPKQGVYGVSNTLGIPSQTIRDVRDGKTWRNVQPSLPDAGDFDPFAEAA